MVETNDRRLPAGIQSFEKIRKDGYLYVDKTDIIWQLANRNKTYNYLSRPRRFGKSVLVDTLEAYFMGKKGLFEGLEDYAAGDGMGEASCHQTGYEPGWRRTGKCTKLSG